MRIIAEVINEIAPSDIEHGTGGDDRAEAHVFLFAPIQNRRLQRAALAQKSHAAFSRNSLCEGGVEIGCGIHESHAVGSEQPQWSPAQVSFDFFFQRSAGRPLLAKTRRDYHRRLHPCVDTIADDLRYRLRRCHHQGKINGLGDVRHVPVSRDSQHLLVLRTHYKYFFWEVTLDQIGSYAPAHSAGPLGSADHRDGARQEQRFQSRPRVRLLSEQC